MWIAITSCQRRQCGQRSCESGARHGWTVIAGLSAIRVTVRVTPGVCGNREGRPDGSGLAAAAECAGSAMKALVPQLAPPLFHQHFPDLISPCKGVVVGGASIRKHDCVTAANHQMPRSVAFGDRTFSRSAYPIGEAPYGHALKATGALFGIIRWRFIPQHSPPLDPRVVR
jgi:hypothetical protein